MTQRGRLDGPPALLWFISLCVLALLAACGGNGRHVLPPLGNAADSPQVAAAAMGSAKITIRVPSRTALQSVRHAAWISPATQSVVISVVTAALPQAARAASTVRQAYNVAATSPACVAAPNGRVCQITIAAPVGNDLISVDLYDGPAPSMVPSPAVPSGASPAPPLHHVGTTSLVATIVANTTNQLTFTVGGLPATLVITPATIVFTPYPYVASGPAGPTPLPTAPTGLTANVYISAQDADGFTIVGPDQYGAGIVVQLYGSSPNPVRIVNAPSPAQVTLLSPSQGQPLTLEYTGTIPFGSPVSLVATANGMAAATSLVVNNVTLPAAACTPQPDATSLAVNFLNLNSSHFRSASGYSYDGLFHIPMSIGSPFPTGSPYPPTVGITLDTGSVGLAVSTDIFYQLMGLPRPPAPSGSNQTPIPFPNPLPSGVTGPTGQGQITYTSDGLMEIGQFFTVPLNIFADVNGTQPVAQTIPTQILVVTNQGCNLNYVHGTCTPNTVAYGVQNMGIGFYPLDIATVYSPVANPFLQLAQELYGQIHRRYAINNRGMFFGGTAADLAGFRWIKLAADRNSPGDWMQAPMCVAYPGQSNATYTCGQMLVDTGLPSMIMNVPKSQQIPDFATYLANGGQVHIIAPGPAASPLALDWTFNAPPAGVMPAYPAAIPASIAAGGGTGANAFINTSQRIIYAYDYAYDADCGAIGFRAASPAPPPVP